LPRSVHLLAATREPRKAGRFRLGGDLGELLLRLAQLGGGDPRLERDAREAELFRARGDALSSFRIRRKPRPAVVSLPRSSRCASVSPSSSSIVRNQSSLPSTLSCPNSNSRHTLGCVIRRASWTSRLNRSM